MQQADILYRPTVFFAGVHYPPSSISTRFEETARVPELQETCALNDVEIDENTQKTEMLEHLQRKREDFEHLDPELQSAVYMKEAIRAVAKATRYFNRSYRFVRFVLRFLILSSHLDCRSSMEMRILDVLVKIQTDMAKIQTDNTKIQTDITKIQADITTVKADITTIKADISEAKQSHRDLVNHLVAKACALQGTFTACRFNCSDIQTYNGAFPAGLAQQDPAGEAPVDAPDAAPQ